MPWSCLIPTLLHVTLLGCLLSPFVTAQQPSPWPETNDSYNSPMSTALIVMIVVFFSVGIISVYLRHVITCFSFHSSGRLRGGRGGRARETRRRGLDPTILNTFPTFFYSDVKIHRVGKTTPLECAVCLSEFDDHELLRLLPKCNHVFHPHCVDLWLASHVTCPVCRANLEIISETSIEQTTTTSEDELSSERPQPSDEDHDVVIEVEPVASGSGARETMVKSPTQELLNGLNLSESGRIIRLTRSHSTGHSLVGHSERFTLRLPVEVRNKLVNDNLLFTAANTSSNNNNTIASPRPGLRASNSGWKFSISPPFIISRSNSPKLESASTHYTPNNRNNNNNISGPGPGNLLRSPRSIFRSLKSPSNKSPLHRVVSCNDIGERSSNRLWDNQSPQHFDLEPHTHTHNQFG